jgi:hypothetical protein
MRLSSSSKVGQASEIDSVPNHRVGGLGATGSISAFIAYPERYEGHPEPEWAAKAFQEDEPSARFAIDAVRTGEPAEMSREIGPMGFWGAWWAVEVRQKRRNHGNRQ